MNKKLIITFELESLADKIKIEDDYNHAIKQKSYSKK